LLRAVAARTGGRYFAADDSGERERLLADLLAAKTERTLEARGPRSVPVHRFQWLLAPAIGLLLLEVVLVDSRRRSSLAAAKPTYFRWLQNRRRREAVRS